MAVSSAPGSGAVGIVRLSGPGAIDIADRIGRLSAGKWLANQRAWTRAEGEVVIQVQDAGPGMAEVGQSEASGTVPAFFHVFRSPRSYTRQDVVEIFTVGSPAVLDRVREACVRGGAVPAQPGEFTARAYFSGAMDLAQAEAVAGIIRAQSDTQLRASRRMMDGALAVRITTIRDQLAELLALVEADIDFAEEPIDFISPSVLQTRLEALLRELEEMLAAAPPIERLSRLPHILLLGPPNAGKSSLMNRLSGTSRAICAAVAGTTRDILSGPIRIGRGEAMLLDTAGVDETEDDIIAQARSLTLSAAEGVDLVCIVLDAAGFRGAFRDAKVDDELRQSGMTSFIKRVGELDLPLTVLAVNKCDLLDGEEKAGILAAAESLGWGRAVAVSAVTGEGVDELRRRFEEVLGQAVTTTGSQAVWLTERQRSAVGETNEALRRAAGLAADASETIDCADLLAFELREALDSLGAVTGSVTTEDLLGVVFANFCIGK